MCAATDRFVIREDFSLKNSVGLATFHSIDLMVQIINLPNIDIRLDSRCNCFKRGSYFGEERKISPIVSCHLQIGSLKWMNAAICCFRSRLRTGSKFGCRRSSCQNHRLSHWRSKSRNGNRRCQEKKKNGISADHDILSR